MREWTDPHGIRVICVNTAVVGTGAAGYNAADCLYAAGQTDVCILTEGVMRGTSRNTGSDKQTYYKLTLSGGDPDSVRDMAETLFDGQCVDGDVALCEAALSAQSFLRLAQLGVPFPRSRYGEYVGYKTDHDPRRRATSAGPYTSRMMTECLQRSAAEKRIPVLDGMQVIRILSDGKQAAGLLCLDKSAGREGPRFAAVCCRNIVWATGGPAGMYADSVYPFGHYGATGAAFEAGAHGQNLTEWQYGLASIAPRWNVSGTYMQVLPRFVSTDADGNDPREFLMDFYPDKTAMLNQVFLKGYQWPFDVRKAADSSSVIDILVYLEQQKGRRVFLDFRDNPCGEPVDFTALSDEARGYLEQAGACFGTPLRRLEHMNAPAVSFYRDKGVDLASEPLEIALCAQHNNGGIAVDAWWRTCVDGLFAAGEAAGTHGVYRPGGSALNAGQVGSLRAAQYIAAKGSEEPDRARFEALLDSALTWAQEVSCTSLREDAGVNVRTLWEETTRDMSLNAGAIRSGTALEALDERIGCRIAAFRDVRADNAAELPRVFRLWDVLICQQMYVRAMLDYLHRSGMSRGSALYSDPAGTHFCEDLPDVFTYRLDDFSHAGEVQEAMLEHGQHHFVWRPVRPVPQDDDFFENVWRDFRENGNVY